MLWLLVVGLTQLSLWESTGRVRVTTPGAGWRCAPRGSLIDLLNAFSRKRVKTRIMTAVPIVFVCIPRICVCTRLKLNVLLTETVRPDVLLWVSCCWLEDSDCGVLALNILASVNIKHICGYFVCSIWFGSETFLRHVLLFEATVVPKATKNQWTVVWVVLTLRRIE